MQDDIRRIGLWVESDFPRLCFGAINRLFAPGLLCLGFTVNRRGGRTHIKVHVARRECWDIRAMDTTGSIVAIAPREYAPQGIMPVRFYQRLHRPWRQKLAPN